MEKNWEQITTSKILYFLDSLNKNKNKNNDNNNNNDNWNERKATKVNFETKFRKREKRTKMLLVFQKMFM